MVNKTDKIVFHFSGKKLDIAIRNALKAASHSIVTSYNLGHVDLSTVTTKTNLVLAFNKFVELGILPSKSELGDTYIFNALKISQSNSGQQEFEAFIVVQDNANLRYSKTYLPYVKRGLGFFLLSLHCSKAITLPMSFKWPSSQVSSESTYASRLVCKDSEILTFIRSIDTTGETPLDSAFEELRGDKKRVEWFATYATKVVLACGWHAPETACLDDLQEVYGSQSSQPSGDLQGVSAFATLIEVLAKKFRKRLPAEFLTPVDWSRRITAIRSDKTIAGRAARAYATDAMSVSAVSDGVGGPVIGLRKEEPELTHDEHFGRLAKCEPAIGHPDRLMKAIETANGDFDFEGCLTYWLEIQKAFLKKKRETSRGRLAALGYLNIYLYFYLPFWYMKEETSIPFPSTPDKLIGALFVSRLLDSNEKLPKTLVEFIEARSKAAGWDDRSHYGVLKQVEMFFDFIIRNSHKIRDSSKFSQPLAADDYPTSRGYLGTNKVPMPRRFLGAFIAYMESFRTYVQYVTDRRIDGSLADVEVLELTKFKDFVDVKSSADAIGYVPLIFLKGKTIPLWYLPGFPKVDWMLLAESKQYAALPHPHALNQLTVALYTGLRNNHIQWLDADKFDSLADSLDGDYTLLFVNTDKVKKKPWAPEVNVQVIHILRDQLRWRNAVKVNAFQVPQFYNGAATTSYPKFLPLFSYGQNGKPHHDDVYANMWKDVVFAFQGFMLGQKELLGESFPLVARLRPAGVAFKDDDHQRKYAEFSEIVDNKVALKVATEITPHSARASVVSELIKLLPAALIGGRITGQTEGTVYHYVVPDTEEVKADQVHQAMHLRDLARRQHASNVTGLPSGPAASPYLKADEVNSNLARSLKVDITEAFARYGCISLSMGEMESGMEILESIGVGNAAFNKTEICPYGNQCPPYIIRELRGIRRCGVCPVAVRSIDHLPAICAKQKQFAEILSDLDGQLSAVATGMSLTLNEVDAIEQERQRIGEELTGWELSIEVLERVRQRISSGEDSRQWVVERPEILIKQLKQVSSRSDSSDYLLARLSECVSYPGFQSPKISRQFDMLRRRILVKAGASLDEVLSLNSAVDAAAECAGVIRTLAAAHKLSASDIALLLTTDSHLSRHSGPTNLRIVNNG